MYHIPKYFKGLNQAVPVASSHVHPGLPLPALQVPPSVPGSVHKLLVLGPGAQWRCRVKQRWGSWAQPADIHAVGSGALLTGEPGLRDLYIWYLPDKNSVRSASFQN